MKKLIIGLASLLFLAHTALGNAPRGSVQVEYIDVEPSFTKIGVTYIGPYKDFVGVTAVVLQNSGLELERGPSSEGLPGYYHHRLVLTLEASPADIRQYLGEPFKLGFLLTVQEEGSVVPADYKLNDITIPLLVDSGASPGAIPPAPVPQPSPAPPIHPPAAEGLPKAPAANPTRSVKLFTEAQVAEAVATALKDTVTLAELEAAEHKAADLAFEEGVAAVQARPDFYGLATTSLLGTQPFVKGWVYTPELEWVNVTEDLFPFVFVEKLGSWVLIQEKEEGLAYFVYLTGKWLTYEELKVSQ